MIVCMSNIHIPDANRGHSGTSDPRNQGDAGCQQPCWHWKSNSYPLKEYQVILTTEPLLQIKIIHHFQILVNINIIHNYKYK